MPRLVRLVVPFLVGALAGCNSSSNALAGDQGKPSPRAMERSIKDFAVSTEAIGGEAQYEPVAAASPAEPPPPPSTVVPMGEAAGAGRGGGGLGVVGMGSIGTKGSGAAVGRSRGPMPSRPGKGGLIAEQKPAAGDAYDEPGPEGNTHVDHGVNPFVETRRDALSTFAVDVDTASYAIARRTLKQGALPVAGAVRVEEFVNYFRYDDPGPTQGVFAVNAEVAPSPFGGERHLLRVNLQAKRLEPAERKPAYLVFLVDVSGSMSSEDKLPLAKRALRILVDSLRPDDHVALVTYASGTRVVLPPTSVTEKAAIHEAIEALSSGGSTAMSSGVDLAYDLAVRGIRTGNTSRVIVLSDGDANVGPSNHEAILANIAARAREGVTLTTVGFGMGNYRDNLMEQLADKGNGQSLYVDSLSEAKRVFQEKLAGTLEVVAQDVKVQVEFDPARVSRYRLVGYENRDVADVDFRNDKVDAGEIGAGHAVTAIYELELRPGAAAIGTVRVRAKQPRHETASELAVPISEEHVRAEFADASQDFRFSVAAAAFAEKLRGSSASASWDPELIRAIARDATQRGDREKEEFLELLELATPRLVAVARR